MAIGSGFTEPGVYSQYKSTALPVLPGGARVVALVGTGRQTKLVSQEAVTRGGSANGTDTLLGVASSLGATIVDANFNTYALTTDYVLSGGAVAWSPATAAFLVGTLTGTFAGLVGTTFKATVGSGSEVTYTFVNGDFVAPSAATATEVAAAIQSHVTGTTCTVVSNAVKIATTATSNTSLLIGAGTSNAILGFSEGSIVYTPKEPAAGVVYTLDYEVAKVSGDYKYQLFASMDDVIAEHGDVTTSNTLSLGSEIVFQQGASFVATVQIDPADGSSLQQFQKAIDKLATVEGINIIVPLSTNPTLFGYLKNHVDTASGVTERKERTAIVGLSGSPSLSTIYGYAQSLLDKRMVVVYPPSCTRYVGTNANVSTLDGSYIAAAIAGVRCSTQFDVAEPLTRKQLVGFVTVSDTLRRSEKNLLADRGVMVVYSDRGVPRVWFQTTTNPASQDTREYSVVEGLDFVGSSMRGVLEAIFVGQKILADTPSQVASTIRALLEDMKQRHLIVDYSNIQARIDSTDSTQIDVSFQVAPVFPLNYILITFSI